MCALEQKAQYFFELSNEKLNNGELRASLSDLDQAIQLDPENLEYYMARGSLKSRLDEYSSGIEDFTYVIDHSKDLSELELARARRASSHEALGQASELLIDLDWLIDHRYGNATIYSWRGTYKQRIGQFEDALNDFTIAYQLAPTDDHLLKRGQAYYELKRYEEALEDFTQIITMKDLYPNYLAAIYRWRGSTYFKLGKQAEALSDFNEEMRLLNSALFSNVSDYIAAFNLPS